MTPLISETRPSVYEMPEDPSYEAASSATTPMESNHDDKLLLLEEMCRNLSVIARREIDKHNQRPPSSGSGGDITNDTTNDDDTSVATRIVRVSKTVMEVVDDDAGLGWWCATPNAMIAAPDGWCGLSAERVDRIVRGCLLAIYRMPSVVNGFPVDTMAFYDWWRTHIFRWISISDGAVSDGSVSDGADPMVPDDTSQSRMRMRIQMQMQMQMRTRIQIRTRRNQQQHQFRDLGWKHLAAMVAETREHLSPPPYSYVVSGAGSQAVNGRYVLSAESCCLATTTTTSTLTSTTAAAVAATMAARGRDPPTGSQTTTHDIRYRYYGARPSTTTPGSTTNTTTTTVSYEKKCPSTGATISLCRCDTSNGHTSRTHKPTWFLTELDEEQPNTDCDKDYYYCKLLPNSNSNYSAAQQMVLLSSLSKEEEQQQNQKLPPTAGWTKCPGRHGIFPAPRVVAEAGGWFRARCFDRWGGSTTAIATASTNNANANNNNNNNNNATGASPALSYRDALAEWILAKDLVPIGIATMRSVPPPHHDNNNTDTNTDTNTNTNTNNCTDEGISSCLDFLMQLYDDESSSTSSSLGTEFLVKFAAWCLSRHQLPPSPPHRDEDDTIRLRVESQPRDDWFGVV